MNFKSIKTKVLANMLVCMILGLCCFVLLMRYSFNRNAAVLASQSVKGAQALFTISEAREVSKMTAVTDTLNTNPEIADALAAKDRARLLALTAPLFTKLKQQGITNWMFHTPEPDMAVFLRLHNPTKFGDHLDRFFDKEVSRTHQVVVGNELAKAGFAVRTIAPVYTGKGAIAGYVEYGEELGTFIHAMKSQTGDDYGLLLNKKFVNRQFWADSSASWHRRDNWDDARNTLILDTTTTSNDIFKFDGDISAISNEGRVLERYRSGDSVFVRGIFPIQDAAGNRIGAIFVVRDISSFYFSMRQTQIIFTVLIVAGMLLGTIVFLAMLNSLIFRRLERMIQVATRVVGGDYGTEIQVTSDDEVGQFEQLFEQFRRVFVDVLSHIPELQDK